MGRGGLELLNDKTPFENSFLTNLDPRIKFIFSFVFLFIIISAINVIVPAAIFLLMAAGLLALKVNKRLFLLRGFPALLIAITILLTQVFMYGKTQLFSINVLGLEIHGYHEGLDRGVLLMSRVMAGISTMLFLTMSTSINKLIFAAKWLHIPDAILEVMTITYRYIFILYEEMTTIKNAQKVRLGFSTYKESIKSYGNLSGMIVIRTIDKSEKLYKAMKSRGYIGQTINVQYNASFTKIDMVAGTCLFIFSVIMTSLAIR